MTREEAIKVLTVIKGSKEFIQGFGTKYNNDIEAIDIAIESLSAEPSKLFKEFYEQGKYDAEVERAFAEPSSKSTVTINSPISFTSDVVSVVRCKDCDREYGSPVCPIQSEGWAINQDTFYCAWGERREP